MSRRVVAAFCNKANARRCAEGLRKVAPRAFATVVTREDFFTLEEYDARYWWLVSVETPRSPSVLAYVRGYTDAVVEGVVVP